MPALTISTNDGVDGVAKTIRAIEDDGGTVTQVVTVGDSHVIVYTAKKRPAKETRA